MSVNSVCVSVCLCVCVSERECDACVHIRCTVILCVYVHTRTTLVMLCNSVIVRRTEPTALPFKTDCWSVTGPADVVVKRKASGTDHPLQRHCESAEIPV